MDKLIAKPAGEGLLPLRQHGTTLTELEVGALFSIAPYPGQHNAVSKGLADALGLAFPGPGERCVSGAAQILWFGRDMAVLQGARPPGALAQHAAISDQSDGWVVLRLSGPSSEDCLARLVPVDLRGLPDGAVVRSLLGHVSVAIVTATQGFDIYVYRSMIGTVARDLADALGLVAGRQSLG